MAKGKNTKAETMLKKIQFNNSSGKTNNPVNPNPSNLPAKYSGFNFNSDGGIQIFRKREIVKPYLHSIDSRIINDQISIAVRNSVGREDPQVNENYDKFLPRHLVNDVYSLFFNNSNTMNFEPLNKTNGIKFNILDNVNNSLIKIVTNDSHIGSYVYTEEITKYLYRRLLKLTPEQQQEFSKAMQKCNQGDEQGEEEGGGQGSKPKSGKGQRNNPYSPPDQDDFSSNSIESDPNVQSQRNEGNSHQGGANNSFGKNSNKDMSDEAAEKMAEDLKNMLASKESKRELEKAVENAEKTLDKLKDLGIDIDNDNEMPEEERKEIMMNLGNIDSIKRSLQSLNSSKDKIMQTVKKILNNSSNYFSPRCTTNDVELFEADDILDINGIEFLHPIFRKTKIMDLSITERHYIGKTDLYVDCSGSMSSGCGGEMNGVCRIDLAKSLALQMKEMGILGELYEFESHPKKILNTEISILMMAARGGTNIETVLQNILKTGNNSIILTDGESHISSYTHKALFIGVGTDFSYFRSDKECGHKFVENSQCIKYNGKDFVEVEPYLKQ